MDIEERFWKHVRKEEWEDGCWLWNGALDKDGYPKLADGKGGWVQGHRFSHELFLGPIPAGLVIDHLCSTPSCVNPIHLEAVPQRENFLRGRHPNARKAASKRA